MLPFDESWVILYVRLYCINVFIVNQQHFQLHSISWDDLRYRSLSESLGISKKKKSSMTPPEKINNRGEFLLSPLLIWKAEKGKTFSLFSLLPKLIKSPLIGKICIAKTIQMVWARTFQRKQFSPEDEPTCWCFLITHKLLHKIYTLFAFLKFLFLRRA